MDPPYHKTFIKYDANDFKEQEHKKLVEFCNEIDKKKGFFMLSNSDTEFIRKLYNGYNIETINTYRYLSRKTSKVSDLIIRNY